MDTSVSSGPFRPKTVLLLVLKKKKRRRKKKVALRKKKMFTLVYTGKAKHTLKLCLESDSLLQEIMLLKLMSECYFEVTI